MVVNSHLFGFGGLGKGGVAAQVEHDDDLAAMAFEDLLAVTSSTRCGRA